MNSFLIQDVEDISPLKRDLLTILKEIED